MPSSKVSAEELLRFVFPEALQHPQSSGRLIVFALYGPLKDGKLRAGQHAQHVVSE